MGIADRARALAWAQLAEALPRRWAHTEGVGAKARSLDALFGDAAEVLVAAALLHDIGYAPPLAKTGFHPLDGARYLRDTQALDETIVRLVANHSFALLEAEERGIRAELEREFPIVEDPDLVDALVYCDMTTTPDGLPTSSVSRVNEIVSRYGSQSLVGRFIERAAPGIHASVARVSARALKAGIAL